MTAYGAHTVLKQNTPDQAKQSASEVPTHDLTKPIPENWVELVEKSDPNGRWLKVSEWSNVYGKHSNYKDQRQYGYAQRNAGKVLWKIDADSKVQMIRDNVTPIADIVDYVTTVTSVTITDSEQENQDVSEPMYEAGDKLYVKGTQYNIGGLCAEFEGVRYSLLIGTPDTPKHKRQTVFATEADMNAIMRGETPFDFSNQLALFATTPEQQTIHQTALDDSMAMFASERGKQAAIEADDFMSKINSIWGGTSNV